jgi:plasmid stabilization system protein ParE
VIVAVSAEAETDLEQIASYIAEQCVQIALNFVQELREKCESLADAPRGYPLVPRYEHLGIRSLDCRARIEKPGRGVRNARPQCTAAAWRFRSRYFAAQMQQAGCSARPE